MIDIHCGTCNEYLTLKFVVVDAVVTVEKIEGYSTCTCFYTESDLMDILEDAYRHECPEDIPKDM